MTDAPLAFEAILIGTISRPDVHGKVLFEALCLEDSRELALKRNHTVFFLASQDHAPHFKPRMIYRIPVLQMEAFYQAEENGVSYSAFLCGKPEKVTNAVLIEKDAEPPPLKAAKTSLYTPPPQTSRRVPKRPCFGHPPRQIGTPQKRNLR